MLERLRAVTESAFTNLVDLEGLHFGGDPFCHDEDSVFLRNGKTDAKAASWFTLMGR